MVGVCSLIISNAAAEANGQNMHQNPQRPRSVIVLSCTVSGVMSGTAAGAQTRMLCQALQQKLAPSLPHYAFRIVPELQAVRGRAGDLLVDLHIGNMRPDHVEAHLEWRHGSTPATQAGPEVRVDIPPTGLTFVAASELAAAVLDASPEMLTELKK